MTDSEATDVQRWIGSAAGPPPPVDGERLTFVVGDPGGLSCETAVWGIRMLHKMRASVWIEHHGAGSLQLTDRGRGTLGRRALWTRWHEGEELTLTATGPDARKALEAAREMLEAPPEERKALYRERFGGLPLAGALRRSCAVCAHPEREAIDQALAGGRKPRHLRGDYPDLTRVSLTRHRDECLMEANEGRAT